MPNEVPHTVKVVTTDTLMGLEQEAVDLDLNSKVPPEWLRPRIAQPGRHFIEPALVDRTAAGRPVEPHLRCHVLIEMANGVALLSLLDTPFPSFQALPENLSRDGKSAAHERINDPATLSHKEWAEKYGQS